jgi:hypothetical protein
MDKFAICLSTLFALALGALSLTLEPASALDPVLAKICREKAIEAHPTKPAGSASGHAQAQRNYYNECIAKGGKMEPAPSAPPKKDGDPAPSPQQ